MASHAQAKPADHFDESDPHAGTFHHAHKIVPPITLRVILGALLLFTLLTVGFAQAEQWAAAYFNIELPRWINVVGAMAIATIKALLVMAFFMQLKYDNPMNSLVMFVTIVCVGLFLFFTGLDLFTRDKVFNFKGTYAVAGGTGSGVKTANERPIVTNAREKALAAWGQEQYDRYQNTFSHGHGHGHDAHTEELPNASRSRPRHGHASAHESNADHADHADHADNAHEKSETKH
jgi:cytochrome c oxidase subunit 4